MSQSFDYHRDSSSVNTQTTYVVKPIAVVRSRYKRLYDAPRQVSVAESQMPASEIQFFAGCNFEQALQDIDGIEHLWVLFWFHAVRGWKPKILPPRGRVKRGVFATRSPHRPNPIGMSVVKNLGLRRRSIIIGDCDMLDGTPVLDVKPYIPLYDSVRDSKLGWLAEPLDRYSLVITEDLVQRLHFLTERGVELHKQLERVLCADPFPHPYRRISVLREEPEKVFSFAYRAWRVWFSVDTMSKEILIHAIGSGYHHLESVNHYHDEEIGIHSEFMQSFDNNLRQ